MILKSSWTAGVLFCAAVAIAHAAAVEAPPTYVLGPGDEVTIWAFGVEEIGAHPIRIDLNGYLDVPVAGHVKAAGLTVDQLRDDLTADLQKEVKHPQVTVSVSDLRSQPVSLMGAVNKPGTYQLQGEKTLLEVLSLAEGVKSDAGNIVRISRNVDEGTLPLPDAAKDASGHTYVGQTSLRDVLNSKNPSSALIIKPRDVITVEEGQMVFVMGDVHKAAQFALGQREKMSALQALSLAEGPLPAAKLSAARLLRETGDGTTREDIPVNLQKVLDHKADDVQLQAGDMLYIPDSASKNVAIKAAEAALSIGTGIAIWRVP